MYEQSLYNCTPCTCCCVVTIHSNNNQQCVCVRKCTYLWYSVYSSVLYGITACLRIRRLLDVLLIMTKLQGLLRKQILTITSFDHLIYEYSFTYCAVKVILMIYLIRDHMSLPVSESLRATQMYTQIRNKTGFCLCVAVVASCLACLWAISPTLLLPTVYCTYFTLLLVHNRTAVRTVPLKECIS